jgi:hypothetical protein
MWLMKELRQIRRIKRQSQALMEKVGFALLEL